MTQIPSTMDHDHTSSTSTRQIQLHNKYERSRSYNKYKYTTSTITQQIRKVTIMSTAEMMEKVWQKVWGGKELKKPFCIR